MINSGTAYSASRADKSTEKRRGDKGNGTMNEEGKRRHWRGLACLALLLAGCEGQDADRLARIGNKVVNKLQGQTGSGQGRLPDSLQSIRGGLGEFALDAKVAARLRWDKQLEGMPIQVAGTTAGVVKLSGTVSGFEAHQRAIQLAKGTTGVADVIDELSEAGGR
jgi:osmotically-inducible protein OsmY